LDHGTDFSSFVDGVPVNLPTHAHGQGYMDLNWVIPELIDYRTSDSLEKKWTCDLSVTRATSGWHIFETNVNRFTLLLQAHGAKPLDNLAQQASLRQG
jgi:hypothetical protein